MEAADAGKTAARTGIIEDGKAGFGPLLKNHPGSFRTGLL
jgi:hypothetical protein